MFRKYIEKIVKEVIFADANLVIRGDTKKLQDQIDAIKRSDEKVAYILNEIEERTNIKVSTREMTYCNGRDWEFVPVEFAMRQLIKQLGYEFVYRTEVMELKAVDKK